MGNILQHGIDAYKKTMNLENVNQNEQQVIYPDKSLNLNNKNSSVLLKTTLPNKITNNEEVKILPDSKHRRVAKFFILIGSEQASEIIKELEPKQIEKISKEIATIKNIDPDEAKEILTEFHSMFLKPYNYSGLSRGGIETARRILYAAKGPKKGEALLNKAVPESKEFPFSFLEEFSAEQLVVLFKSETNQTVALILSRLPPKLSAKTLNKLPPEKRPEVLKYIAYQKDISPEVLEQVTTALREKVRNISAGANDLEIDGVKTLAEILKQGDYAFGDKIINELEMNNPDIGKNLKENLYTLDDIIYTIDRPIQEKLSYMTERDIAILLKGRSGDFCDKILSCISAGRRQLVREESEILGAVPRRDCDTIANEFLSWFRTAREKGDIILYGDKDVIL